MEPERTPREGQPSPGWGSQWTTEQGLRPIRLAQGAHHPEQGPETRQTAQALTTPPPLQSPGSRQGLSWLAAPPSPHGLVWTPRPLAPSSSGAEGRAGLRQTGAGVRSLKSFLSVISLEESCAPDHLGSIRKPGAVGAA